MSSGKKIRRLSSKDGAFKKINKVLKLLLMRDN